MIVSPQSFLFQQNMYHESVMSSFSWSFIFFRFPKNAWNFSPSMLILWDSNSAYSLSTDSNSIKICGIFDFPLSFAICISSFQFISTNFLPCPTVFPLASFIHSESPSTDEKSIYLSCSSKSAENISNLSNSNFIL